MPAKKTSEVEALEPVARPLSQRVRNEVAVEAKIKFSTWFVVKTQDDARLKAHHLDTLKAYVRSQGLSLEEPARRYEAALRSYFGH